MKVSSRQALLTVALGAALSLVGPLAGQGLAQDAGTLDEAAPGIETPESTQSAPAQGGMMQGQVGPQGGMMQGGMMDDGQMPSAPERPMTPPYADDEDGGGPPWMRRWHDGQRMDRAHTGRETPGDWRDRYGYGREDRRGAWHHPMMPGGGMMHRLMFVLIDRDGNRALSLEEARAAQELMFDAMDADGDGGVTPGEIGAWMERLMHGAPGRP